ncbi:RNA polymerase sigma-70 factor, ECF subfamily [Catalinimonas alkaloidigena]|uniref:RNA polymerase sigma-70 factor, ECF subfamily n=1 Tax=Catalinimonas alkaloidigena TaxID=1075417 RepID=A0A1G9HJ79_9BACT|nr:sigma-70 family RNA polymerase sigma factor [Catalinimonas alkaloidigena]SDL12979.1 RNA polymerase sigma-70 factor, ECF subfamily [Catalinimonas alkaloidigena]
MLPHDATDSPLLARLRAGEQAALQTLFTRHYRPLCDFACQLTKSPDLAEEVVADIFLILWQKRRELEIHTSLRAYLYVAVRRRALQVVKKEHVWDGLDESVEHAATEPFNPLDVLLFRELNYRIDHLVDRLPDPDRLMLRLKMSGLTYKEIAETLELSVKTVEYRLAKSIERVKRGYQQK